MTVFSVKQVVPVNYEAEVSQRLIQSSLNGDIHSIQTCIADPLLDVNFTGAVSLKTRKTELLLKQESASEVNFQYEEFTTDVTALFVAVHCGNLPLVKKLLINEIGLVFMWVVEIESCPIRFAMSSWILSLGADVNQKLFKGFATTVAVREGYIQILEILIRSGASQPACEEALIEASCHGRAKHVELLIASDLIRPHVAVHALVTSCFRGFTDVVEALIKCGVDSNATDRMLLQSLKPALHTNVDCNALVAAVVSRQVPAVRPANNASIITVEQLVEYLWMTVQGKYSRYYAESPQNSCPELIYQEGAKTDIQVQLGAWSWDTDTGEEFRVGAGLAEQYPVTWCAVEYFEITGSILTLLLQHHSPNTPHLGRCLIHHAILCGNAGAVKLLLKCGANVEAPVEATQKINFRPIHMAARLNSSKILQCLIDSGCDLNSMTDSGNTGLMICTKYKHEEALRVLARGDADFGLVNSVGQSVSSIAGSNGWIIGFQKVVVDLIKTGKIPNSSNLSVFSPLLFAAEAGDVEAMRILIGQKSINLDYQDDNGFSAVMVTAMKGHVEAFRLLVYAKADVMLCNKAGENAITLSKLNPCHNLFEKVMLEFALENGNGNAEGFYALHYAACHGDLDAIKLLTSNGYDVNLLDGDSYTPLMLAAREGHMNLCQLLISHGAHCDIKNTKGETALSLAKSDAVRSIILDELARNLVLQGTRVLKHTKGGKGSPHGKEVKMVGPTGVLRWGKSRCRNVICREVEVGASLSFNRNRRKKGDVNDPGVFRIVTTRNKEVHFVCDGGVDIAKLWVRGIILVTKNAISGKS
ncbi:hypothetical protein ACFE04_007100 [Oxalis oulophora]